MSATILQVKVIPNAAQNKIEGWQEGILRVRIRAIPEKGKANEMLISYLAEKLDISKSSLRLVSGQSARIKRIAIESLTKEEIEKRLGVVQKFSEKR